MLKRLLCSLFAAPLLMTSPVAAAETAKTAHDFSFETILGEPLPLAQYKGKPVLVVNTASECGFTGQYEGLQSLWERYKDRGLVVLAVPANDFGGQEPGNNEDIKQFCESKFQVSFPIAAKAVITGDDAHPFYRWARETKGWAAAPKWNFHKYLIAPDGQIADHFNSMTKPESDSIIKAIEPFLAKE